jgi:predicted membrane metal-binding protein
LFCLFGLFALVWRKTLLTLAATAFFFAFWHTFLTSHNQGFQLSRTLQLSNHVHRCLLSAQTESTPFHWTAQMKQRLLADVREVDGFPVHFRVSAELNGSPMQYGDRFVVDGRFALPDEPLNPGEFDYHGFLNRQGVYLLLQAIPGNRTQLLSRGGANLFVGFALRLRHSIEPIPIASLEDDPTIQALIRGILFGDRSTIPPVILDELQDTGTLHLFVIGRLLLGGDENSASSPPLDVHSDCSASPLLRRNWAFDCKSAGDDYVRNTTLGNRFGAPRARQKYSLGRRSVFAYIGY